MALPWSLPIIVVEVVLGITEKEVLLPNRCNINKQLFRASTGLGSRHTAVKEREKSLLLRSLYYSEEDSK